MQFVQNISRRVRHFVAERLYMRFLGYAQRMPVLPLALPQTQQSWLVLAPHPDDEAIGCGGLILALVAAGHDVDVAFVSANDQASPGSEGAIRWQEALAASKIMGHRCLAMGLRDGAIDGQFIEFQTQLQQLTQEKIYRNVICPFPSDHHRDHRATALFLKKCLPLFPKDLRIYCYEIWSALWPNRVFDISTLGEAKRAAIQCYQSQLAAHPYDDAILGLNHYRGLALGVSLGEGYFECDGVQYARIAELPSRL